MRKFLIALSLIVATAAFAALPAVAVSQGSNIFGLQVQPFKATPVGGLTVAADTAPALVIKYNGAGPLPKVANTGGTSITFTVNAVAYDGFECPVSGDLGGIIDVTNGSCDTLGEVVDSINSDVNGNFVAVIAAGLRADSSASLLTDAADTDVATPAGEVIYWDSSSLDDSEIVLVTQGFTQAQYGLDVFGPGGGHAESVRLPKNPWAGTDTVLLYADENIANLGTIGNFDALCVAENYVTSGTGSETATVMYRETGASTGTLGQINEFLNSGGLRCRNGKVVVRIYASGADTSAFFVSGYGYRFKRAD